MLKKARLLTRPTPARRDAPFRRQGRKGDAPFATFHVSRFTPHVSRICGTPLADFFSILLGNGEPLCHDIAGETHQDQEAEGEQETAGEDTSGHEGRYG